MYKETTVNKVSSTGRAADFLGEEKELLQILCYLFTQQKYLSVIPARSCLQSGISAAAVHLRGLLQSSGTDIIGDVISE